MFDSTADPGRRAWLPCPRCRDDSTCESCHGGRTCAQHWRYLLGNMGGRVFVQCPSCRYRWWHNTEFGVGDRPRGSFDVPDFPASSSQAG
ncbi:MAG: hypothetical protein M3Z25_03260 [Actinomycetota bacterium]|nr:hypothetical protein [Actinomycetota bacterium]